MSRQGYLSLGYLSGTRLRLHWSLAAGALLVSLLSSAPLSWLAYLAVILVHELGHALLVKQLGFGLLAVELTAVGGSCRLRGDPQPIERAWIAWGGVLGQALLLGVSSLGALIATRAGLPQSAAALEGSIVLNAWILAINLLPLKPFDGAEAWRLFPEASARGWPLSRTLLFPLQRWAEQRRARRLGETPEPPAQREGQGAGEPGPAPSPEAQRELAALFERIANEAARARRRD